jgi:hypothetical protein
MTTRKTKRPGSLPAFLSLSLLSSCPAKAGHPVNAAVSD